MKIKLHTTLFILLFSISASAQWTTRASLPGIARAKATAFTIGDKIFMMGGVDNSSFIKDDFWQYDITGNTWTQKSNFPGPERYGAVSFVLNNFGFIVAGGNDNGYLDDLWHYDPVNNIWMEKTGFPATTAQHENQRVEAFAFTANGKAYVGGGSGFVFMPNSTNNIAFFDLWEYDPISDDWTQKSDIPDFLGRNLAIATSVNGKGYVGLGCDVDQTLNRKSFWEYDPVNDTWTAKANFPSNATADAGAVIYNSQLYVVGGVDLSTITLSNQVYRYDPGTDTWTQLPSFTGNAIAGQFSVTTATSAFMGGGYNASIIPRNDLWEITNAITGIENNSFDLSLNVYPNPCTDYISISSQKKISLIEIYDSKGSIIIQNNAPVNSTNVSELKAGNYEVKITYENGQTTLRSIIKD